MRTALVICRNPSGLSSLSKVKSNLPLVLASDDPRVQEEAKNLPGISHICFIEQKESFWTVADDVKNLIKEIDEWLVSLDRNLPKEVLAWGTHIEGGITNQRVQDSLLLIRSYMTLFSVFDVAEIHVITDPSAIWEDRVLEACASSRGLLFRRYATSMAKLWGASIKSWFVPLAKAAYFLFYEALLGGGRLRRKKIKLPLDGAIIFQLCGSARKHVDNVRYIMEALLERGTRPVGICWSARGRIARPAGHEQLAAKGIPAIALEKFVTLGDMITSLVRALACGLRGWARFEQLNTLENAGVSLSPLLRESFWHFFIAVLPQRIRYARVLSECLAGVRPAAIKPWGGGDLFEGKYALSLFKDGNNPIFIHYWLGAGLPEWPYTNRDYKPALFLAKSPFEAQLAIKEYQIEESQVKLVGQARFENLPIFGTQISIEMSRRLLKIPSAGKLYIGLDPGGVLRGYQTYREQLELVTSVLGVAQEVPSLIVVIKPHPSYGINHLLPLIRTYNKYNNIVVLQRTAPVDHFLNAIDVIVTKYSTLILEAALMGRCAIAVILDSDERFKVFGDLPQIVRSGDELVRLITQLAVEQDFFSGWKADRLFQQRKLLPYFYSMREKPSATAANEILKRVKR